MDNTPPANKTEDAAVNEADTTRKPFLTPDQLVDHLKSKGITFNGYCEESAKGYLSDCNNYLRTASYRKLFPVHAEGASVGQYIGLDFLALVKLSSVDRKLRAALREIVIDVEHFARVSLLNRAVAEGEDGYKLVKEYFAHLRECDRRRVEEDLARRGSEDRGHDEYTGDLIAHYDEYPLWVFLEAIEFGRFCDLYLFCANRWRDSEMQNYHYVLKSVKSLRNAVCHNNCIINGFSRNSEKTGYRTPAPISSSMNELGFKKTKSRRAKLKNLRVAQIAAALYVSHDICPTESARRRHAEAMHGVCDAFRDVQALCPADGSLTSYFDFITKLVDIWLPIEYTTPC